MTIHNPSLTPAAPISISALDPIIPAPPSASVTATAPATPPELWTPPFYIAKVREVLGGEIDLDPFSCADANATVGAKQFFTPGHAPFRRAWNAETVFIHPPASRRVLNRIPKKFFKAWNRHHIRHAIILLDVSSPEPWYERLVAHADATCLTHRPIPFLTPGGETQTSGDQQVFLYFGADPAFFREVFASVGAIRVTKQKAPRPRAKKPRHRQPAPRRK